MIPHLQTDWLIVVLTAIAILGLFTLCTGEAQAKRPHLRWDERIWVFMGQLAGGFCFVVGAICLITLVLQRCSFFSP